MKKLNKDVIIEKLKKLIDKIMRFCKKTINNYRNFKTLPRKSQVLHIVVPIICFFVIVSLMPGGNSGIKGEALVALANTSALPYGLEPAVSAGVYKDISVSQMLNYMFENPSITYEKDSDCIIITISGNCRTTVGSDIYPLKASISYQYSPSTNSCMVYSDPNGVRGIMESMAVELARQY